MITKLNIRLLILLTSIFLAVSIFAQVPKHTTLKRGSSTIPAGKVAFVQGANLIIYDTSTQSRQTIASNNPLSLFTCGGGKITYTTTSTLSDVFVVPIDGSGNTLDTGKSGFVPTISPDGSKIAYVEYPGMNLAIMNSDGTGNQSISTIFPSPIKMQWVPGSSNTEISYISSGKIIKYNINTQATTEYTLHTDFNVEINPDDFFWKPDGSAFVYSGSSNKVYIYTVATSANTLQTEVTSNTAPMVKWQPNGSNASYITATGLTLYNPSTTTYSADITAFASSAGYDWTQDSNNIAYSDPNTKLTIFNISTGISTALQEYSLAQGGMADILGVALPQWIPGNATAAITSISPKSAIDNQGIINITVNGRNFPTNPQIKLSASITSFTASSIVSSSDTQIVFQIDANSLPSNVYSVDVYDSTGKLAISEVIGLTVTHANQAPVITPSTISDIPVNEDSGPYSFNVTIKSGGPLDAGQTIQVIPSSDNTALLGDVSFVSIDTLGLYKITITPAANKSGVANFTVKIKDNGGTLNGGIDTTTVSFKYTVNPVNDPPSFDTIADVIATDSSPKTIILTNVIAGPADEASQTLTFHATSSLATLLPDPIISKNVLTGNWELVLNPIVVATSKTAKVTIMLQDNGGTANEGVDSFVSSFNFTVNPINIAPNFNTIQETTIFEDNPLSITVSGLTVGNSAEDAVQTLSVTATSSNTGIITPSVTMITGGFKITGTPTANANGTVQITVKVKDSGGTLNGGIDTFTQTFNLDITAVNDAPSFSNTLSDITTSQNIPINIVMTDVTAGGNGTESSQALTFSAISNTPDLVPNPTFTYLEGIWTMTISPIANVVGFSDIDVILTDDGGTANGGINSYVKRFRFTHIIINTPPSFDVIPDQVMNEDSTLNVNITNIKAGSSDIEQLTQQVTITATTGDLTIMDPPVITSATGSFEMKFTPKPNANGVVTITVIAKDNGGIENGGVDTAQQAFSITVNPVNDAPSAVIPTISPVSGDGNIHSITISSLSVGPANESTQTIESVTAITDTSTLLTGVRIDVIGGNQVISYTPVNGQSGTGNLIITVKDSGGTLKGGIDTTAYNVPITIVSKPDVPTFISPVYNDYTSGNDKIQVSGTATLSKIKYHVFKQQVGSTSSWIELYTTDWNNSSDVVTFGIPSAMTLTSGAWNLKLSAEDERGGITEGNTIMVTVPTIMPPSIISNSLILFGMPIKSSKTISTLPSTIKLATYDTSTNTYLTSVTPLDVTFDSQYGYWIRSTGINTTLKFTGSITNSTKSIPLSVGWNLIPNPYYGDITWSVKNIQVIDNQNELTLSIQDASDYILPYAWTFTSNSTEPQLGHYTLVYDDTILPGIKNTIPTWNGFWVKALKECEIFIPNPNTSELPMTRTSKRNLVNGWSTRIIASCDKGASEVVIGVCDIARNLSLASPPASPLGSAVKIAATRGGNQLSADFIKNDENKEWTLVITKDDSTGNNVMLNWPDISSLSGKQTINLTDVSTGKKVSLNEVRNYSINFAAGETTRTIKLSISKRAASALQITNVRTENNRNSGQIKFDLSSPAIVTMTIRNLVGKMITCATLDAQSAGSQTMNWNSEGKSAGKYIIELKAADKDGRSIRATSFISIK